MQGGTITRDECNACRDVQLARRDMFDMEVMNLKVRLDKLELAVPGMASFAEFQRVRGDVEAMKTMLATARGGYLVAMALVGITGPILGAAIGKYVFGL